MRSDASTLWPEGWGPPPPDFLEQAMRMVLRGEAPPAAWRPFIVEMDFSNSEYSKTVRPDAVRVDGSESLRDLSPLAGLTALQTLVLNGTQVSDVTPLAGLTALQTLRLEGTQVSDVTPLRYIKNLRVPFRPMPRPPPGSPLAGDAATVDRGV